MYHRYINHDLYLLTFSKIGKIIYEKQNIIQKVSHIKYIILGKTEVKGVTKNITLLHKCTY